MEENKMNKKILGIPIALFVVGLLVIGGASAALVSYLSNEAEVSVTVESPVLLEVSTTGTDGTWLSEPATLSLDNVYGGEPVTFFIRDTNLASVFIAGSSRKLVTNPDGVTCGDFKSVIASGTDLLGLDEGCVEIDANTVDFSKYTSNGLDANEATTTEVVMAFQDNALGTYTFIMQKMVLD